MVLQRIDGGRRTARDECEARDTTAHADEVGEVRGRFSLSVRKRVAIVDRFGERLIRSRRHVDFSPEEVVIEEDGLSDRTQCPFTTGVSRARSAVSPTNGVGERCL